VSSATSRHGWRCGGRRLSRPCQLNRMVRQRIGLPAPRRDRLARRPGPSSDSPASATHRRDVAVTEGRPRSRHSSDSGISRQHLRQRKRRTWSPRWRPLPRDRRRRPPLRRLRASSSVGQLATERLPVTTHWSTGPHRGRPAIYLGGRQVTPSPTNFEDPRRTEADPRHRRAAPDGRGIWIWRRGDWKTSALSAILQGHGCPQRAAPRSWRTTPPHSRSRRARRSSVRTCSRSARASPPRHPSCRYHPLGIRQSRRPSNARCLDACRARVS